MIGDRVFASYGITLVASLVFAGTAPTREPILGIVAEDHCCKFLPHLTVIPTTFAGDSYDT